MMAIEVVVREVTQETAKEAQQVDQLTLMMATGWASEVAEVAEMTEDHKPMEEEVVMMSLPLHCPASEEEEAREVEEAEAEAVVISEGAETSTDL